MCSGHGRPDSTTTAEGPLDAASLLATLRDTPTSELEASFRELDTLENATGAYKLLVLAVLDERDVGREDGTLDTIGLGDLDRAGHEGPSRGRWSRPHARCPTGPRSAPPHSKAACRREQLAAVVQVATPDTDAAWAATLPAGPRRRCSPRPAASKTVTRDEAVERDRQRKLGYRWDEQRGELRFWGRVPDADGAGVVAAVRTRRRQDRARRARPVGALPAALCRRVRRRAHRRNARRERDRTGGSHGPHPRSVTPRRLRRSPARTSTPARPASPSRMRPSGAWPATRSARPSSKTPEGCPSSSDGAPGRFRSTCSACSSTGTGTAEPPAVAAPSACTPITSCTGPTAASTDLENLVLIVQPPPPPGPRRALANLRTSQPTRSPSVPTTGTPTRHALPTTTPRPPTSAERFLVSTG